MLFRLELKYNKGFILNIFVERKILANGYKKYLKSEIMCQSIYNGSLDCKNYKIP